jgi:hypothetical protein
MFVIVTLHLHHVILVTPSCRADISTLNQHFEFRDPDLFYVRDIELFPLFNFTHLDFYTNVRKYMSSVKYHAMQIMGLLFREFQYCYGLKVNKPDRVYFDNHVTPM